MIYTARRVDERGYAKALAHARHRNQVIDEMLRGQAQISNLLLRAEMHPYRRDWQARCL